MGWVVPESFLLRMKSNCVWSDSVRSGLERAKGLTEIKGTVTLDKDKNVVKLCGRARDILALG